MLYYFPFPFSFSFEESDAQPRLESLEIKIVPRNTRVTNDIGDDPTRHIARMPGERDEFLRMERIRIMAMAAGRALETTADLLQTALQIPKTERRIFSHFTRRGRTYRGTARGWDDRFP